jgi:hypothetical protein
VAATSPPAQVEDDGDTGSGSEEDDSAQGQSRGSALGAILAGVRAGMQSGSQQQAQVNQQINQISAAAHRTAAQREQQPTSGGASAVPNRASATTSDSSSLGTDSSQYGSSDANSCVDVSGSVDVTLKQVTGAGACAGEVHGSFTNRSSQDVDCKFVWKGNDIGSITVRAGGTVSGAGAGLWSCNADPSRFRYICYPRSSQSYLCPGPR